MKIIKTFLILTLSFSTLNARAEVRYLDDILSKATLQETQNLGKLLQQIQLAPAKDLKTGQALMRVIKVDKGSVYDREGVKAGDFVLSGSSKKSGRAMELKNQLQDDSLESH